MKKYLNNLLLDRRSKSLTLKRILFFMLLCNATFVKALTINGETSPCPNTYYTYSLSALPAKPPGYLPGEYTWTTTNGFPANIFAGISSSPQSLIWNSSGTGSIRVDVRFTRPDNPDIVFSATLNITVKSLANPCPITGKTDIAEGDVSNQVYSVGAVTNATSYEWTLPTGWTFKPGTCTTCNQIVVNPPANGSSGYICVKAKNSICGTTSTPCCIYVTNKNVYPVFAYTNPSSICTLTASDITLSINSVPKAISYSWTVSGTGSSFPANTNATSVVLHTNPGASGPVTITVTAYFPYGKQTQSSMILQRINQVPAAPTFSAGPYLECVYHSDLNINVSNVPIPIPSYLWTYTGPVNGIKIGGGGPQGGPPTVNIIAMKIGSYNVYAKAKNACGTSLSSWYYPIDVISCSSDGSRLTSTDKADKHEREISFYPNPAANSIELLIPSGGAAQVKLMALNGQMIKQFQVSDQQTTLNVSDVPSGLYILNIQSNGENVNKKIEITH